MAFQQKLLSLLLPLSYPSKPHTFLLLSSCNLSSSRTDVTQVHLARDEELEILRETLFLGGVK